MVTAVMKLRHLVFEMKAMTNLNSVFKIRDITLPPNICLVKAMVFAVVVYGCKSWTIKNTEHRRIDAFFFLFSGFCHTLTWISHGFTCVPHPDPPYRLPLHPIPLGLPSAPALSTCFMHPTWTGDLCHPWYLSFDLWCWRRLLRVLCTTRRSN